MNLAPRQPIIGKGGIGSYEYVGLDVHTVPELDPALDGNAVADNDIVFVLTSRPTTAPSRMWANAQIRVPEPIFLLSHSAFG
jgi:hypothetical protein